MTMSVSISNVSMAAHPEWDAIWEGCDYATYYHSREWAEIWNVYTQGAMRPDPRLVTCSDGKKALLPLSYERKCKGLVKEYVSSPAGTFGGWISAADLGPAHAAALSDYLSREFPNLTWRMNPYDENLGSANIHTDQEDETHVLRLQGGFDSICRGWTKGHRSAATKARNEGVTAVLASTMEDWRAYYRVYEDSLRRWGEKASSRYEWKLFEEMCRRSSGNIRLWLAAHQDRIIAGALCLYAKRHVAYWHGAALAEHFTLRPVNLVMYEAIKHACEQGYAWFDFNPSGGHEGVRNFKKSFGAEALSCPVVTKTSASRSVILFLAGLRRRAGLAL